MRRRDPRVIAARFLAAGAVFCAPSVAMAASDRALPEMIGGIIGRVLGGWLIAWLLVAGVKFVFARRAAWRPRRVALWLAVPVAIASNFDNLAQMGANAAVETFMKQNGPVVLRTGIEHIRRSEERMIAGVPGLNDPNLQSFDDLAASSGAVRTALASIAALRADTAERYRTALRADDGAFGQDLLKIGAPQEQLDRIVGSIDDGIMTKAPDKFQEVLGLLETKLRATMALLTFLTDNASHWSRKEGGVVFDTTERLGRYKQLADEEDKAVNALTAWQSNLQRNLDDVTDRVSQGRQ